MGGARAPAARLVVSADAASRLAVAAEWLRALPAEADALVVAPTWEAADDLARAAIGDTGARFGLVRLTLERLAARLAAPALARTRRAPASGLALVAVAARAIHLARREHGLGYFAPVAERPGFPLAVAHTLAELRMNGVEAEGLEAVGPSGAALARLLRLVERELARAGLADRALVFAAAVEASETAPPPVGTPLLLLDLPVATAREAGLVAALARRAPAVLATAAVGDEHAETTLARLLGVVPEPVTCSGGPRALASLQRHLFEPTAPEPAPLDDSVALASWPGEARECVEIARAILAAAGDPVHPIPFDRVAVFLHAPTSYTAHLEEAFGRAGIPAFFAGGTARPHPGGRALLALLACAAEGLSARRFAEYLSLAQVPDPARPRDTWVPPADDLLAPAAPAEVETDGRPLDGDARAAGTLRAPWRWEQLLVDAAVIGGAERWARRLEGLAADLALRRRGLEDDEPRARVLDRQLEDLAQLRAFALPLIECLARLPGVGPWAAWLEHLEALAREALREPEPVLATLAELAPMAPVGPVELDEVRLVLAPRLREIALPPPRRRYGAVLVAPATAARGLTFDVVLVPGLAEKIFPGKIVEDPILRDDERATLDAPMLVTQPGRVASERLALRLAVGAAERRVVLSFPRVDVEQARPRVPSFYALEALRAAEGMLPGFDELGTRAAEGSARLGWPAPEHPADAIDEAEYDLALLAPLVGAPPGATTGTAHYLLGTNPHLARALRARARRWIRKWTPADGLVEPDELARAALARHQLRARAFSPTALQHFAACPYRFFLQAIHRLTPREEPVALETLDPLTRGALVHETQFEALVRLKAAGLLPVHAATLERALALVDGALDEVARRYAERLAPAIARVWEDGIAAIRADLREWTRRQADAGGWVPHRFELSFGLVDRDRSQEDPTSVAEPVAIEGGLTLRGSVDLVERHPRGVLRATDHKTGKVRGEPGLVVGRGEILQPLLYALACERVLDEPVESGRLYYCTADGGFTERVVPLDEASRAAARTVAGVVDRALREGFLPAAPRARACEYCDYRPVCGPYEELRVEEKPQAPLADLMRLREMP